MPQIVVTANEPRERRGTEVLRERIATTDLESDQFAAHLVERIGWALADADTIEDEEPAGDGRGKSKRPALSRR